MTTILKYSDWLFESQNPNSQDNLEAGAKAGAILGPLGYSWGFGPNGELDLNAPSVTLDFPISKFKQLRKIVKLGTHKGNFVFGRSGPDEILDSLEGSPRKVIGDYECSFHKIPSLKGSPSEVIGDFLCKDCGLDTLKGGPEVVEGSYDCSYNKLTTLEGAPKRIEGRYNSFNCSHNYLTSLKGAPLEIGSYFNCAHNRLTSLKGLPKVGEGLNISHNQLTSLEGCPEEIRGDFFCNSNRLTSLKGGPRLVEGGFHCVGNPLTSLEGFPDEIGEDLHFGRSKIPWNINGWLEYLSSPGQNVELLEKLLSQKIMEWIKDHPLDLDLLDEYPEIKADVLKSLDMKDYSRLAKRLRDGII